MSGSTQARGYVVPSYRALDDTSFYHFLHGNVPGHQIDFMYRPEVPQGPLSRQHFSHLARLMRYIEPPTSGVYAFAIGNLSRDDTQYEPGHGGVALIFGLRIRGVTDHAGRQDPPFAHGIAAIDRELDYVTLLEASLAFHRRVFGAAESAAWYRSYVRWAEVSPADMERVLAGYVSTFVDLPRPPVSAMGPRWVTGGAPQPKRIAIVHEDNAPFERLADCACRIAAMLYRSDIRWTSISNGREPDLPNGVSIRFIAEGDLCPNDAPDGARRIDEVPEEEAEIARQLFGATPAERESERVLGWRERYAGDAKVVSIPVDHSSAEPSPAQREKPGAEVGDLGAIVQPLPGAQAPINSVQATPAATERALGAPILRWTLMAMAVAAVVVATLYFAFAFRPATDGGAHGTSPPEPTSSIEPPAPPAATLLTALPAVSGSPPAPPSSAALPKGELPVKGGKPSKGTQRPGTVFDAPLKLPQ